MIKDLKRITEEEMLKNWALAEIASIRRRKYLGEALPPEILKKSQEGNYEFSEQEWQQLTAMIRNFRSPLLDGLLMLKMEWYEGVLPAAELTKLQIMNWPPFVDLSGSRKLIDLAKAFLRGEMPPKHPEFAENLEILRKDFGISCMRGKPIIVSQGEQPPYILVEGFTRLSAMMMNMLEGKTYEANLPIILGVSKRLSEWNYA